MEVEIDMMECDNSIVKNVKHEEPTSEAGTSGSLNSDMSYHDDDDDDEMMDNVDDVDDDFDLDYDGDYMFEILESADESHYLSIQSRFDNINLPPGVEVSFFWLNNLPTVKSTQKIPVLPLKDTDSSSLPDPPNINSTTSKKEDPTEEANKMFERLKLVR